jgi:hypothetical protein
VVDNQELSDINDIVAAFEKFYKALFKFKDRNNAKELRSRCQKLIPKKITEDVASILSARILVWEIFDAISTLKKDKAPRLDGLPAEF